MDTVRSEYSDTSSTMGTSRYGASMASVSFVDSSSYNSSCGGSTTRSDFLSNYEHKFQSRKAEKKKKREREKRLAAASTNQMTADEKRRADRETERIARKAEMATWLPTEETLHRLELDRKKRSREMLREVLRWYPETNGKESELLKRHTEIQPLFLPDSPDARDAQRMEHQRAEDIKIQSQTSDLQRRVADLQQKMACVEQLQSPAVRAGTRCRGGGRGGKKAKASQAQLLAPLANSPSAVSQRTQSRSRSQSHHKSRGTAIGHTYFFRDAPTEIANAIATEEAELDAFLSSHKRHRKREHAARKIQATWRMVRQRRRFQKWRMWRAKHKAAIFQVWALSHRLTKQARCSVTRKYLRAWRNEVDGAIELRLIELKLFRDAETQPELPKFVMNLVLTASDDDDAYTRRVLANPAKQSYYTGCVNAAFLSVEQLSVVHSKNRVRLLKVQHLEARRAVAKKIVQRSFLLWKRVHADEKRIGLNAQLCIKRAARLAFQHRPVWAGEKMLTIFELWTRWAAFSRAKRLGIPMPHFAQPLPLWDVWLHNYHERQIRKIKAVAKAPMARMKRCFRSFRALAAHARWKRIGLEMATTHFRLQWSKKVLLEWRDAITESASNKKCCRAVLHGWRGYIRNKIRLRPLKQQVTVLRFNREQQRTWSSWRSVQLRSCFKRELNRARLGSQPKWRWKVQRLLLVWMDIRSQLHKWKTFIAWKHYVQRRKLFLTLRAHCDTLRRIHLLLGVFGAWKAVVWKQEDTFLEDRLQLGAWDACRELAPLVPKLFYGSYADAGAIFAGVAAVDEVGSSYASNGETETESASTAQQEDILSIRQRKIRAFHAALLHGSVVEARNLVFQEKHLINGVDDLTGNTALHVAAGHLEDPVRRLEIVTLLLSEGACTWDKPNRHGLTPKQLALDDQIRFLLERGVYAFHSRGVLKQSRQSSSPSSSCGWHEARLLWSLVAIMSSEYVRGDRIAASDFQREWHSILKDELWLRQEQMTFASTSEFSPSILRCRAFLNGMKRRICRRKEDILTDQWARYQNEPDATSRRETAQSLHQTGGGGAVRSALIKSATRRMLSRDLARMQEKIDLLSWLKNTPDDPTRGVENKDAEEEDAEAEEQLHIRNKVCQVGEYGAYAEWLLSPVLNDDAAERALIHSFVSVLYSLSIPLDAILAEAVRLEDECVKLERAVLDQYQAIMHAELRSQNAQQPMGLPLMRLFTEAADAEFFFKKELLHVDVELWRRRQTRQDCNSSKSSSGGGGEGDTEESDYRHKTDVMAAELRVEASVLLAKAQRKQRKVDKKVAAVQQQVAQLDEEYARVLLSPAPRQMQMAELCGARMRLESERLKMANGKLKQLEWVTKINEVNELKQLLDQPEPVQVAPPSDAERESTDDTELLTRREFLAAKMVQYALAFKAESDAAEATMAPMKVGSSRNLSASAAVVPMTEIRRLHKTATATLLALFIANLFRCGCCWLVENLTLSELEQEQEQQEEEPVVPALLEGVRVDGGDAVAAATEKSTSAAPTGLADPVSNAVANTFAAARKASAADVAAAVSTGGRTGGGGRLRGGVLTARTAADALERNSWTPEVAEIQTTLMRENYVGSSQLLFQSDRQALQAEEDQQKTKSGVDMPSQRGLSAAAKKKINPEVELNPNTGLPETPSSRLMDDEEVEAATAAAIALISKEDQQQQQKEDTKMKKKANRKREQLRHAMAQHQLQRLQHRQATEGALCEGDEEVGDQEPREATTQSKRGTTRVPRLADDESVVHGDSEIGFGNFVASETDDAGDKRPQPQPPVVVGSSMSQTLSAISAESLWKRGGGVRHQGDASVSSASSSAVAASGGAARGGEAVSFELFASAADEMAFNASFRAISASKDRRATPASSKRLSAVEIAAGRVSYEENAMREETIDNVAFADGHSEVQQTKALLEQDDDIHATVNGEHHAVLMVDNSSIQDGSGSLAASDIRTISQVDEVLPPAAEEEAVVAVAEHATNWFLSSPSLPSPAALPDLASVVSATEEAEFFDQTLQHYLDRVRRDSFVAVAGTRDGSQASQVIGIEQSGGYHDGGDGEDHEPMSLFHPIESDALVETMSVDMDGVTQDCTERMKTPYIKWQQASHPIGGAGAGLVVECTRVATPQTPALDSNVRARESPAMRENLRLQDTLRLLERSEEEAQHLSSMRCRRDPQELELSGKTFTMGERKRRKSSAVIAMQNKVWKRIASTASLAMEADAPPGVVVPTATTEDGEVQATEDLAAATPSPFKIVVAIQRKPILMEEAKAESAATPIAPTVAPPVEEAPMTTTPSPSSPTKRQSQFETLPLGLCELSISSASSTESAGVKEKPSVAPPRRRQTQVTTTGATSRVLKKQASRRVTAYPMQLCLEGASLSSVMSSAIPVCSGGNDSTNRDSEILTAAAVIPALTQQQRMGVWQEFTSAPLTDAMQDAYAQLYPHLYDAVTPASSPPPTEQLEQRQRHRSNPTTINDDGKTTNSTSSVAAAPIEKQIAIDKRFWSAVEGYKAVGAGGLISLDDKSAQLRRQDRAVAIYQQFLCPNAPTRLVWLDMYEEELRLVERLLLMAPKELFDTLQQTTQLHISTMKAKQQQQHLA